jgi:hypothetical protein
MKKLLFCILLIVLTGRISFSQCNITNITDSLYVCPNDSIYLSAIGECTIYHMNNNFNNGTVGVGWISNCGETFTNPCLPSVDGTTYLWVGPAMSQPRNLTTVPYDIGTGCKVCFDMAYAIEGEMSPCEGPDQPNEGVHFQYSTNGGVTWVDLNYWPPDDSTCTGTGGFDSCMTIWRNYCVSIPPQATSPHTMFQWHQNQIATNGEDHWGLDNIMIFCQSDGQWVWNDGTTDFSNIQNPSIIAPSVPGIYHYYVTLSDSLSSVTDTVVVQVNTCTGIDNPGNGSSILVYPNPAKDEVYIQCQENTEIQITDLNGRILNKIITTDKNSKISLSGFPKGIYILKCINRNTVYIEKLVVD